MTSNAGIPHFDASLGCLIAPRLVELAAELATVRGLSEAEREVVLGAARETLIASLHPKVARLLLVELNAARVEGRLQGDTPEARWNDFIARTTREEFWEGLSANYPTLLPRLERLARNRTAAVLAFAKHWAEDCDALTVLCGRNAGALLYASFGAGDAHRGGHSVAIVACEGGRVVYKPRSVAVEAALAAFIAELERDTGLALSIRVPSVIDAGDHGWAEFVEHRHASGPDELSSFYRGIGHSLALMRLLSGTDFHAENLIAHGGTPVLVDCETLFAPRIAPFPTGFGDATDRAMALVSGTVLATGMLPGRGQALGWRGVDVSGVGALPGQQPTVMLPDIIDAGTDKARFGMRATEIAFAANHPATEPSLRDYWPVVLDGFVALSEVLRGLDTQGAMRPRLARFETCEVRAVLRATEVYSEVARMLWHPVSLHNEDAARVRARDLLLKMGANVAGAPNDPEVVDAEIEALVTGDIPYFSCIAREGQLEGPGGVHWLSRGNRVDGAYEDWRQADLAQERGFVHAALVSAYVNDSEVQALSLTPKTVRYDALEKRRRVQAAGIMRQMIDNAIFGRDGSATWLAPTLTPAGWAVQSLGADLYGGVSGVAILAAAYVKEQRADRADPVDGLDRLLAGLLRTMDGFEAKYFANKQAQVPVRPQPPSVYLGLGSQIWMHMLLSAWGLGSGDNLARALTLARDMPVSLKSDETLDLLSGRPGAIPVLLALWRATGDREPLELARAMGDEMCERAVWQGRKAHWTYKMWPQGLGGYAHGVTGVGWALHLLAQATDEARYRETADGAFAYEDGLFDASDRSWTDLRNLGGPKAAHAWCHGSVGIGLARLDLDPTLAKDSTRTILRDAAAGTWRAGVGWSHTLCHGDAGAWELLDRAAAHGEAPEGLTREDFLASFITSLEDHGPLNGFLKDAFVPGLFPGLGGIAWQLLLAHPASGLPSLLTLGGSDLARVIPD